MQDSNSKKEAHIAEYFTGFLDTHTGVSTLSDRALYNLCQEYGKAARMWSRKFTSLLPEVEKRTLYKNHGFYSIFEFAAKIGGLGHKTVEEVLRTYKKVQEKPLLKAAIEKEGWAKVRAVTPLIGEKEERDLVEMVRSMPKRALEVAVREIKERNVAKNLNPPGWEKGNEVTLSFKVDKETEFRLRKFQQNLEKTSKEKVAFGEVLKSLLDAVEAKEEKESSKEKVNRGLETTVKVTDNKKQNPRYTRYIPAQQKRAISTRFQGKCVYPNCNKPSEVLHHPERYAISKNHDNLKPLCNIHHLIAHAGLIENEEQDLKLWRITEKADKTDLKYMIDREVVTYHNP